MSEGKREEPGGGNWQGRKVKVWGMKRLYGVCYNIHTPINLSVLIFQKSQGLQGMECGQCPDGLGLFLPPTLEARTLSPRPPGGE